MAFHPDIPYNELPLLPPAVELETKEVLKATASANRVLGELKGKSDILPNPKILINTLTLQEAKDSSEIENVFTTTDKLYEGFAAKDDVVDSHTKEVLRYREALWAAFEEIKSRPIATNLFIRIVQTIKQNQAGVREGNGTQVVSEQTGKTMYTPPVGEKRIRNLLRNLEKFIHEEQSFDALIKMALVHYQFEAIHPFPDGNGRTGRILNVLYLVHENLLKLPILYLSSYIIAHKHEYYELLRNVTERGEWEPFVLFMLRAVEETAHATIGKINSINVLLSETIQKAREELPKRVYSKELIELLFEHPDCKIGFVVDKGLAKRQAAADYLNELEKIGILKSRKSGREKLYRNTGLYDLFAGKV